MGTRATGKKVGGDTVGKGLGARVREAPCRFNFREHLVNVSCGELVPDGTTNSCKFLPYSERLPDPFRQRHTPRLGCSLDFPMLSILEKNL